MPLIHNKIGFLASGAGGNPSGIGAYVQACDAAGRPCVVLCNDGDVGIADVLSLDTDIPHIMGFRVVRDGTEFWSVPDYYKSPEQAAHDHWAKIEPHVHPTVKANRDKVWIFPVNEVDKNRPGWLGDFHVALGAITRPLGYKIAAFGWSAGEPEPEHWLEPGMVRYLELCASDPEYFAINVHEYWYEVNPPEPLYTTWHMGRFEHMHAACDSLGIPRPKIIIGEWGWTHNDNPGIEMAVQHIDVIAEQYAQFPNLLGGGIWYLGPYQNSDIHNKTQKLIAPVTDLTVNALYDVELDVGVSPEPPPDPDPPPEPPPETTIMDIKHVTEFMIQSLEGNHGGAVGVKTVTLRPLDNSGAGTGESVAFEFGADTEQVGVKVEFTETIETETPTPPPAPPPPSEKALFIDVSHHIDVDLDVMKANGVKGVMIRTSNGIRLNTGSTDAMGVDRKMWHYIDWAWRIGLPFGLWHYLNENYDERDQVLHFLQIVSDIITAGYAPSMGLYLDCEGGDPGSGIAGAPRTSVELQVAFFSLFEGNVWGFEIGNYSSVGFWNPIVSPAAVWPAEYGLKLWAAAWPFSGEPTGYPSPTWSPTPLNGFDKVDLWQWTSQGGNLVGHTSKHLDLNFVGDTAPGDPEPPDPEPQSVNVERFFDGGIVGRSRLWEARTRNAQAQDMGQQRHQTEVILKDGGEKLVIFFKGGDGWAAASQFEMRRFHNGVGALIVDTSHSLTTQYRLTQDGLLTPWILSNMVPGVPFQRMADVTVQDKASCNVISVNNSVVSYIALMNNGDNGVIMTNWTSPENPTIVLSEVIRLRFCYSSDMVTGFWEDYFMSADPEMPGLVGFATSNGLTAFPSEHHAPGQRPDSVAEDYC